ncbi:hypothetical protein SAMN05920897_10910 [Alkalispirochaeta americana]|uniref:Uncharacterized protein n=2 Tax=Alkalispirochaeta americana TaxID=159291 RepID=A0A1N6SUM3_9SPIO|nr:hypothetical protein SAMN05920897_10910 [Alkalispirochaeta americana]
MFVGSTANNRTVLSDVLVIQKETQDEWLAIGPSRVDGKDSNHYWLIVTETDWTAETDEVRAVFFANPATMRIEELEFTSATFFSEI